MPNPPNADTAHLNVLSLFAGIGGLELGLQRAGMNVVEQVEIDPYCRAVLARHWPEVPRHDDVRTCVAWWRSQPRPPVHVVAGGFPCQPFSSAGKRLGKDDPRWLWPAFADVIRDLRPRWVLLENVPGLLGRGMGDVLGDLATCGYDAEWDCVPAAAVGAPHRRDRVFILAYASGERRGEGPGQLGGLGAARRGPNMADPDSPRRQQRPRAFGDRAGWLESANACVTMANADGAGLEGPGRLRDSGTAEWPRPVTAHGGWWSTEPDVGRVAHGIPARVDRLRSLGNAVVPQVAEHIGRLIVAADRNGAAA